MNAWNARNATNGNKIGAVALLTALTLFPLTAHATNGAGALYDVKEVVVQFTHFVNTQSADICGLTREDLTPSIANALKINDVPTTLVTEAKPPKVDEARIDILPDVITLDSGDGLSCTSWISLTAQNAHTLTIPPVKTPRTVNVLYWKNGLLIKTGQVDHKRRVIEAYEKLVKLFAQQYKVDQPPDILAPDTKDDKTLPLAKP